MLAKFGWRAFCKHRKPAQLEFRQQPPNASGDATCRLQRTYPAGDWQWIREMRPTREADGLRTA
jgi:hypothetical protein